MTENIHAHEHPESDRVRDGRLHALVHRPLRVGQVDDRARDRARARPARPGRRVPRRRLGPPAPLQGPRVLEGGPRHEHRADRLGRLAAHAPGRRRDRGRDLPVPRDTRRRRASWSSSSAASSRSTSQPRSTSAPAATSTASTRRRSPARSRASRASTTRTRSPESPEIVVETEGKTPEESAAGRDREARGARPDPGRRWPHDRRCRPTDRLIRPHGGELVDRLGDRPGRISTTLETVQLDLARGLRPGHARRRVRCRRSRASWARPTTSRVARGACGSRTGCRGRCPSASPFDGPPQGRPGRAGGRVRHAGRRPRGRGASTSTTRSARRSVASARPTRSIPGSRVSSSSMPHVSRRPVTVFDRGPPAFPELALDPGRHPRRLRRARAGSVSSGSRPATRSTARTST